MEDDTSPESEEIIEVAKTRKRGTRIQTFKKRFNEYPFSDEIKRTAAEIAFMLSPEKSSRGLPLKRKIWYCLDEAHKLLGIDVDSCALAKTVGIEHGDMTRARSAFSRAQTGFQATNRVISASSLIPVFGEKLGMSEEAIIDATTFSDNILVASPELRNKMPRTVAAGMIAYYAKINGITIPPDEFIGITDLTKATITAIYNQISAVYNK